jgi:tetratricopeptide (TPR) repeat protein
MSVKKLKKEARVLITKADFGKAKAVIDTALQIAPDDLTVLEVLDYWYESTDTLSDTDKLRGSLSTIERMLEIQPSGEVEVFDDADYYPSLYHVRLSVMSSLVQETFDLKVLRDLMDGYEKLFSKPGFSFHLMDTRDATFEIVAKKVGSPAMTKVFGDLRSVRKKFSEQRETVNDPRACRIIADRAMRDKEYDIAAENYRRSRSADPKNLFILQLIAICEIEQGDFEAALQVLSEVPKSFKFLPEKEYHEAQALSELGRLDEAIDKLNAYGLADKEVGKKGTAARDIHFRDLWNRSEFEELIKPLNSITKIIKTDREEAIKELAKRNKK